MTIDPFSSSSIRDSVLQLASSQLQNAHADVKSRNDHIHAAKEDYQVGDVKGAEQEQQAALSDQQNVLADRSALLDFRKNVQTLPADLSQRAQDIQTFKAAIQSGDLEGAKAAFKAFHQDQKAVISDGKALGLDSPKPTATPVNVTA